MKEEEFKALFIDFGEINEVFLSGKGFGFLRLVSFLVNIKAYLSLYFTFIFRILAHTPNQLKKL
jgi:hypothetical protein